MDTGEGTCTVENKSSSPYKIDSAHNTSTMSMNMNISTTQENSDQSVLSRNSYRDSKDEVSYSSTTRQEDGSVSTSNLQFLAGTMIPYEMYRRYRTLLEQKRDIKKKLKSFDEQFSKEKGRAPKKTDKEVRPYGGAEHHDFLFILMCTYVPLYHSGIGFEILLQILTG